LRWRRFQLLGSRGVNRLALHWRLPGIVAGLGRCQAVCDEVTRILQDDVDALLFQIRGFFSPNY
jgi:hypothetical protein